MRVNARCVTSSRSLPPWRSATSSRVVLLPMSMQARTTGPCSGLRHDDALEHVPDMVAGVDRLLQPLHDVLPADDEHRVDATVEERGQALARDAVPLVLQAPDLHEMR